VKRVEKYMRMALEIARRGRGKVSPNPLVGAVIVKGGKVIAKGWHERYGGKHAEANAIEKAGKKAKGADLYVTLEPCNHYGKQPPCTKAVIRAGIKRAFIAMEDPNKLSRHGAKELERNGIKVEKGICRHEAEKQNEFYIKGLREGRPFVTLKIAMSSDGFISFGDGRAKRISGRASSDLVQKMRKEHDAVLVGINTVLRDDPLLTVRNDPESNPLRIVLDSKLSMPKSARMLVQKGETIIVCTEPVDARRRREIAEHGGLVIVAGKKGSRVSLRDMLSELYKMGVQSVLVEAGNRVATSFLSERLADRMVIIVSGRKITKGLKAFSLKRKIRFGISEHRPLGKDTIVVLEKV